MDEIALTVTPDDDRRATHELEVDAQRLPEAFDEGQRRIGPTAFDDGDVSPADADRISQLLLCDVEGDAGIAAERRERSPEGRWHVPIGLA